MLPGDLATAILLILKLSTEQPCACWAALSLGGRTSSGQSKAGMSHTFSSDSYSAAKVRKWVVFIFLLREKTSPSMEENKQFWEENSEFIASSLPQHGERKQG